MSVSPDVKPLLVSSGLLRARVPDAYALGEAKLNRALTPATPAAPAITERCRKVLRLVLFFCSTSGRTDSFSSLVLIIISCVIFIRELQQLQIGALCLPCNCPYLTVRTRSPIGCLVCGFFLPFLIDAILQRSQVQFVDPIFCAVHLAIILYSVRNARIASIVAAR